MSIFDKISAQQKGREGTAVWMVGEQLKDICRSDPQCAKIVDEDLDNKAMSIAEAEKKIKAWADVHRKSGVASSCTPPNEAARIIREFYGLPDAGGTPITSAPALTILDLGSLL